MGFVEKWHFERSKLAARIQNRNRAKISFIFLNPHVTVRSRLSQVICKCTRMEHCELPGFHEKGAKGKKPQLSIMLIYGGYEKD